MDESKVNTLLTKVLMGGSIVLLSLIISLSRIMIIILFLYYFPVPQIIGHSTSFFFLLSVPLHSCSILFYTK